MVIGFDGSRAFQEERTGTENYSYQLLKALAKIDSKNRYIVYLRPSSSQRFLKDWPPNFQFSLCEAVHLLSFKFFWTQAGLALQTFKDKPDILFVPAHTLPIIRRPGLKTVITVHDLGSEYLPGMHQLKQRLYLGFMQKYQLQGATKIIAVSQATKEDLIKKVGIEPKKISVVYEGYNKKLFKSVKGDTLVNTLICYDLQPKTYYLFVGTVQPRKNLARLIRAFSHLSDNNLKLVIAGLKGWLSDEIYELPKKLGIEDRVKFLGYVPEEDIPALYSGAVALTFPSLFEGFGLPILEAQACGCPVLTSNISSMPEVAGKGAVYVDPYNIDDIVDGMEKLQVTDYRLQVIKAGLGNVRRFSWEKCAGETLEVLLSSRRI